MSMEKQAGQGRAGQVGPSGQCKGTEFFLEQGDTEELEGQCSGCCVTMGVGYERHWLLIRGPLGAWQQIAVLWTICLLIHFQPHFFLVAFNSRVKIKCIQ